MPATFYGFEIARTGLNASQIALNVTGHNMANADTEGYTRQRVAATAILPYGSLAISGNVVRSSVGGGVQIVNIEQIRDTFLDNQLREKSSQYNNWAVKEDMLMFIEKMFDETADSSITVGVQNFIKAFQDLSAGQGADSAPSRETLRQSAFTLTETLNHAYAQLVDQQKKIATSIENVVDRINIIADAINTLNEQIFRYELSGANANDLLDRRNLLLDELSTYTDFTIETHNGQLDKNKISIKIGGEYLVDVSSGKVNTIYIDTADVASGTYVDGSGIKGSLKWNDATGTAVSITEGQLRGYLDMRDGDTDENYGIPTMVNQLDLFTKTFVETLNAAHSAGYTLLVSDGMGGYASVKGVNFFDPACLSAGNIKLSDEIISDIAYIAASSLEVVNGDPTDPATQTNSGQNKNLLSIIDALNAKQTVFGATPMTFEGFLGKFVATLGGKTAAARARADGDFTVLQSYVSKRESISGVNIDEEAANLTRYQRSYAAAARVLTSMDEVIDTLIHRTGICGR